MAQSTIDKDLKKVVHLEQATYSLSRSLAVPGLTAMFFVVVLLLASLYVTEGPLGWAVIAAAVIGGYMALSIGANDVANNMGPAVGSRALTLGGAIVIAAICEAAGAMLAGGDVVSTISSDLIHPDSPLSSEQFIILMMAALLASAMWIHVATILGAPVSTTHAIVGAVVGSAIAAAGAHVVDWHIIARITASWLISPVVGGIFAAALLGFVKWSILFQPDRVAAARRWVPVLIALMLGVFAMYMASKGVQRITSVPTPWVIALGAGFAAGGYILCRPWVRRRSEGMENRRKQIATLFSIPLIFAAALLSFAHGANDVANAVGPLAAIVATVAGGSTEAGVVELPLWVLAIGAAGISIGLSLFGPRLIRTVGEKITKMDPIRAYCVALSAAVTVLFASALGLPVSSTHIAVGAIFGVGFLRERLTNKGVRNPAVQPRSLFLEPSKLNKTPEDAIRNQLKRERRRLVRRQHLIGIVAAWVITVPASAALAAVLYTVMGALAL
ncbi:phosphate transporter [Agaricicola taiwanensis]|uniref:Phosphate transporter n=1 Tax=Agaricicola taiwanensis TaxID=591372 RepID=A0A8J2W291_9RHOB|nr:inorganic phosphate transporter [Agaricicola taiwanensis]GGE42476.1 phosphate transporter [Agaricicola taiwanensis]